MFAQRLIAAALSRSCPVGSRRVHGSPPLRLFFERDEKGGYPDTRKRPSAARLVRDGLRELRAEVALWAEEARSRLDNDQVLIFRAGETDVAWRFGDERSLERWVATSDRDHGEGRSECALALDAAGNAVFSGTLDTGVPRDGRVKRAGYCNVRTVRHRRSFKREAYLDWTSYNQLVLKVRGDGRSYMLNVHTKGYYDITWNDVYHYALYTRGGPYWQLTRVPFSKFFLSSKGRIQDRQAPLPANRVTGFGITAADKVNGPFNLEIQYVGLEFDPNHTEEFAYEMYSTGKYIAGV